jgi:hypothetical protein
MTAYKVKAHWDADDRVWWAECAENHGAVAEAASVEGLLAPDLVALDLQLGPEEVGAPIRLAVEGGTWAARSQPRAA